MPVNIHFSEHHIWKPSQEPQKTIRFNNNTLFCTFLCRQRTIPTWKCLFSRFVEDVKKDFLFFFPELRYSQSRYSTPQKFANIWRTIPRWKNKRDKVWISAKSLFKRRFRSRRRRCRWTGARTWSKIISSRSRSLIGQLSCESYTFKPLMSFW